MVNPIFMLLLIPVIFSLLFLISKNQIYIRILSVAFFVVSTISALLLVHKGPQVMEVQGAAYHSFEALIMVIEVLIIIFLYYISIKYKRWNVLYLTIFLTILSIYSTLSLGKSEMAVFNVDKLSLVMALIINIIGSLIVLFSNEYIEEYEHHRSMKSKQRLYYFVVCIFLSAMNGLIFSDHLSWMYFFWEITTIISFVLISYNGDEEALNSGFRALFLNLIGGISFSLGIILFSKMLGIDRLSALVEKGPLTGLYMLPVFLLCIAGFAKSAQLPFQSWLLGAMVAPTPVSALLHSSTMVKAGVFLIIKLSPSYAGTALGTSIALYGGFCFLLCSALAITQRNAKRVLAYSTIANLGLIISSAGMGTTLAVSAAIMLIIFHSISKALLFLCTGQIEHIIGSRDIEDMAGLIRKAPIVTILTAFGMLSMIVPPFGVLITKWISIEAAAKNPVVTIFLILGSSLTSVYYIKWLGTILAHPVIDIKPKYKLEATTYFPLGVLGLAILGTSIFITPIFNEFVSPEVIKLLRAQNQLIGQSGKVSSQIGTFNDSIVFLVLITTFILFLIIRKLILVPKIKNIYMCGENAAVEDKRLRFRDGMGNVDKSIVANLYFGNTIDEEKFTKAGYVISIAMLLAILIGGLI